MTAGPPPWRVFDAPPGGDAASSAGGSRVAPAPTEASDGAPTGGIRTGLLVRRDVLAGAAAALGGLVLAWLLATGGTGGSVVLGGGTELIVDPTSGGGPMVGGELVVDVVGAVLRPGVYHLPAGSRIADAIAAAGGYGPRVAAERVDRELNLAASLHDGEQVVVPSRDDVAASPRPIESGGEAAPIDLNSATESELDTLPGIGPVTAAKIVASRTSEPFRAVQDLLDRKLVGQKTFDSIKGLVTVG